MARNEHIQQWLNFAVQKSSPEVLKRDSRTDYNAAKISVLTSSKPDLRTWAAQEALECSWSPQRALDVELCRLCGSQDETDNNVVFESDALNAAGERAGTCSEQQTERNTHIVSVPLLVNGTDIQKNDRLQ